MAAKGNEIQLNTDTGFLKLIAIISMVIDHAGVALWPQYPILRIIGRIAFPIFAYGLTVGCVNTHSMPRYVMRIGLMAILVQPLYAIALHHQTGEMMQLGANLTSLANFVRWYLASWNHPGIFVSLFAGLLVLWSLRTKRYIGTFIMLCLVVFFRNHLDYGWKGIVLITLFYLFRDKPLTSLVWVLGFMAWWGISTGNSYHIGTVTFATQGFAVLALPLIYLRTDTKIKLNKWFFYLFYPAHLAVILLLDKFVL